MKRPDRSWPLPHVRVIPTIMTLKTLADDSELLRQLRKIAGSRPTWRHVAVELTGQPPGADPADVSIVLAWPLTDEGRQREPGYGSRRATDHSRYWSFDSCWSSPSWTGARFRARGNAAGARPVASSLRHLPMLSAMVLTDAEAVCARWA